MHTIKMTKSAWDEIWTVLGSLSATELKRPISKEFLTARVQAVPTENVASNCISALRAFKILNQRAELTPLGKLWISNDTHDEACRRVYESFFPKKLQQQCHSNPQRKDVVEWLHAHENMPEDSARKTASFFIALNAEVSAHTPVDAAAGSDMGLQRALHAMDDAREPVNPSKLTVTVTLDKDMVGELITLLVGKGFCNISLS